MLLIQSAGAIEISFGMDDSDGSAEIISSYEVDEEIDVFEEASASSGVTAITNSRSVSGNGNIKADQTYSGSDGQSDRAYLGQANFQSAGSGSLTGSTYLTPKTLGASQDLAASGLSSFAGMSLAGYGQGGRADEAGVNLQVDSGSMTSSQGLSTGSIHAWSNSHIEGVFSSNTFSSSTYSTGSSVDRNNVPHVSESVDLYQRASAPGVPGTFDRATFNVNPQFKIQDSVDAARPYDAVSLSPGFFQENVDIWKSLEMYGAGSGRTVMDAGGQGSVFAVDTGVTARLTGMTIQGGRGTPISAHIKVGGGIYNLGALIVDNCIISNNPAVYGGGIYNSNSGSLTVNGGAISRNSAEFGGGIDNHGITTINGATISDNHAAYGGGVSNRVGGLLTINGGTFTSNNAAFGGGIVNYGTATINRATISGNSALVDGGGIRNEGIATFNGCTISSNSAVQHGGGIDNEATATINGGIISENSAKYGGGVLDDGRTALNDVVLSNNFAITLGGGICSDATVTINGGSISGNLAGERGGGIYSQNQLYLNRHNGQKIAVKKNSAASGGGIYGIAAVHSGYDNCEFGTGADANTPDDHYP